MNAKRTVFVSIVSLFILQGYLVMPAGANSGPPYRIDDGDAQFLIPQKSETIDILSENLAYYIEIDKDSENAYAQVSAQYSLRSSIDQSVLVAFVSNNSERVPEVVFENQTVSILDSQVLSWKLPYFEYASGVRKSYEETPKIRRDWYNVGSWTDYGKWEPTFSEILYYMSNGTVLSDSAPAEYTFRITLFEITVQQGALANLSVSYTEVAAVIRERGNGFIGAYTYGKPYYEFYYFLEPAQYWNSFADLTITINVNGGLNAEKTSLSGFIKSGDIYTAHFDTLPDKNLRIIVEPGQPRQSRLFITVLVVALLAVIIVALVLFITHRKRYTSWPG